VADAGGSVHGSLFTRDFLLEGIADTEALKALDPAEFEAFPEARNYSESDDA